MVTDGSVVSKEEPQTSCLWRRRGSMRRGRYESIVQWLWDKTTVIPPSKLPSITCSDRTKVLIVKAHKEACTLIMSTTQTVFLFFSEKPWQTQYSTRVCKHNAQGTNAWLWYMCNRVFSMIHTVWTLSSFELHSVLEKKQNNIQTKKEIWLPSKHVLIFFQKDIFFKSVFKIRSAELDV